MDDDREICLTHTLTPPFLSLVNTKIKEELGGSDNQLTALLRLVAIRHKLVTREISKLAGKHKQRFVTLELEQNKRLEVFTLQLLEKAKGEVINLKRAKHAVKRYK
ncbi:hypothetical protein BM528_09900 [Alteromonas sp. RW2A1]|jgi:hypothetical protein|nr:hypothetical protein BM528_09900 [Alteromonas sp. RW2A1]